MSDPIMNQFAATFAPQHLAMNGRDGTYRANSNGSNDKTIGVVVVAGSEQPLIADGSSTMDRDLLEVEISSRSNDEGHIAPTLPGRGVPDQLILDGVTYYLLDLLIDGRKGTGVHRLLLGTKATPAADAR